MDRNLEEEDLEPASDDGEQNQSTDGSFFVANPEDAAAIAASSRQQQQEPTSTTTESHCFSPPQPHHHDAPETEIIESVTTTTDLSPSASKYPIPKTSEFGAIIMATAEEQQQQISASGESFTDENDKKEDGELGLELEKNDDEFSVESTPFPFSSSSLSSVVDDNSQQQPQDAELEKDTNVLEFPEENSLQIAPPAAATEDKQFVEDLINVPAEKTVELICKNDGKNDANEEGKTVSLKEVEMVESESSNNEELVEQSIEETEPAESSEKAENPLDTSIESESLVDSDDKTRADPVLSVLDEINRARETAVFNVETIKAKSKYKKRVSTQQQRRKSPTPPPAPAMITFSSLDDSINSVILSVCNIPQVEELEQSRAKADAHAKSLKKPPRQKKSVGQKEEGVKTDHQTPSPAQESIKEVVTEGLDPKLFPRNRGIRYVKGERLEARDELGNWYHAKIVDVNAKAGKVRIHFLNWNSRHDIWLEGTSDGLKKAQFSLEGVRKSDEELIVGDYVFAKWPSSGGYFPARVQSVEETGYNLTYYDGFERITRRRDIRKMSEADIQTNIDPETFGTKLVVLPEIPNKLYDPQITEKVTGKRRSAWRGPDQGDEKSEGSRKEGSQELLEVRREALQPLPKKKREFQATPGRRKIKALATEELPGPVASVESEQEGVSHVKTRRSSRQEGTPTSLLVSPKKTKDKEGPAKEDVSSADGRMFFSSWPSQGCSFPTPQSPKWAVASKKDDSPDSQTGSLKLVLSKTKGRVSKISPTKKSPVKDTVRTSQRIQQRRKIFGRVDVKEVLKQRRRKLRSSKSPVKKEEQLEEPTETSEVPLIPPKQTKKKKQTSLRSPAGGSAVENIPQESADIAQLSETPPVETRKRKRVSQPSPTEIQDDSVLTKSLEEAAEGSVGHTLVPKGKRNRKPKQPATTALLSDSATEESLEGSEIPKLTPTVARKRRGGPHRVQTEEQSDLAAEKSSPMRRTRHSSGRSVSELIEKEEKEDPSYTDERPARKGKRKWTRRDTSSGTTPTETEAPIAKRLRTRKETDEGSAGGDTSPRRKSSRILRTEPSPVRSPQIKTEEEKRSPAPTNEVEEKTVKEEELDESEDKPLIELLEPELVGGATPTVKSPSRSPLKVFEVKYGETAPPPVVSAGGREKRASVSRDVVVKLEKLAEQPPPGTEEAGEVSEEMSEEPEKETEEEEESEENEFEVEAVEVVDRGSPARSPSPSPSELTEGTRMTPPVEEGESRSATPTYGSKVFNPQWMDKWGEWLRFENGEMFCEPCRKSFSHSDWGMVVGIRSCFQKQRVDSHSKAWQHLKAVHSFRTGIPFALKKAKKMDAFVKKKGLGSKKKKRRDSEEKVETDGGGEKQNPEQTARVEKIFAEFLVGRDDWLKGEGDRMYCASCRLYAPVEADKKVLWAKGIPKNRAAMVPSHEISTVHKKNTLRYYEEVLKVPPPLWLASDSGLKWQKVEHVCSVEGCGKSFRTVSKLAAHVRHNHPEKNQPLEFLPLEEVKKQPLKQQKKPTETPKEKPDRDTKSPKKRTRQESTSTVSAKSDDESSEEPSSDDEEEYLPSSDEARNVLALSKKVSKKKKKTDDGTIDVEGVDEEQDGEESSDEDEGEEDGGTPTSELSENDLVRCICQMNEENGFMLQCDHCMTWQHGECFDIPDQDSVPEEYVCYVCKNPKGLRESRRYREKTREIWQRDGMLPELIPSKKFTGQIFTAQEERAPAVRTTNLLAQQATELNDRLKAIRYRMNIASSEEDGSKTLLKEWAQSASTDGEASGSAEGNMSTYDAKGAGEKLKAEITSMQESVDLELEALDQHVKGMELEWRRYGRLGEDADPQQLKSDIKTLIRDLGRIRKLSYMLP